MLPLSRIAALSATVDDDWQSSVADAVAAAWGYAPGSARFWRSSARHVFVMGAVSEAKPRSYLRFVPADCATRADVEVVALLMERLSGSGAGCVRVLPSDRGNLVESVDTSLGLMWATLVAAAPGEQWDVDDLNPERARAWGAALGAVHRDGTATVTGLPLGDGRERAVQALALLGDGGSAPGAVSIVRARLDALPRTPDDYGLIHGDYELDNLAWADGHPTAFDWDEAEWSWFGADVAYAVRDLVPDHQLLVDGSLPLLDEFLVGYRGARPASDMNREQLVVFTALNALRSLARLHPVLAEDAEAGDSLTPSSDDGSPPRPSLRVRLEQYAERQRRIVADLLPLLS